MRFLNYIKYCSYIFLGMMAISSCCHHSEYLFPNYITVSGVRSNDTVMVDVDEFDSYRRDSGLTMDSRYVIYQLVKSDANIVIDDESSFTVYCRDQVIKPKIVRAKKHIWRRAKKAEYPKVSLFALNFKTYADYGDTITLIERNFPHQGDSIVINTRIPDKRSSKYHLYYSGTPEIRKYFPK